MRRLILILLCATGLLVAQPVTVTLLATTDMHGNLVPVDYVTGQPVPRLLNGVRVIDHLRPSLGQPLGEAAARTTG